MTRPTRRSNRLFILYSIHGEYANIAHDAITFHELTNTRRQSNDERDEYEHGSTPERDATSHHALRSQIRQNTIDDRRDGVAPYINSQHAIPLSGDAEIDKPRVGHGKPEWQARRRPRHAGMASHATTTASRNGEPRDDHGKPEWRATRRPRQAGMASHAQATTRRSRRAGMARHAMDTTSRNGKNAKPQPPVGSTLSTGCSTSCARRVEELPWLGETREGIHQPQR